MKRRIKKPDNPVLYFMLIWNHNDAQCFPDAESVHSAAFCVQEKEKQNPAVDAYASRLEGVTGA